MNIQIIDRKPVISGINIYRLDKNCQTITFKIDRVVNDNDLTLCNAFIKTLRADGFSDKVFLQSEFNEEENKICLTWSPKQNDTYVEGELKCQISFESDSGLVMNTELFILEIKESISGYESVESGYVPNEPLFSNLMTRTETQAKLNAITNLIPEGTNQVNHLVNKNYVINLVTESFNHRNDSEIEPLNLEEIVTYSYVLTESLQNQEGVDYYMQQQVDNQVSYVLMVSAKDYDSESLIDVSGLFERTIQDITYRFNLVSNHKYFVEDIITKSFTFDLPTEVNKFSNNEIYVQLKIGEGVSINWGENRLFYKGEIPVIRPNFTYEILINYMSNENKWCICAIENGESQV